MGFDTQELLVCLVTATHKVPHLKSFVNYMSQIPQVRSVLQHYNPLPGEQVIRDATEAQNNACYTKVLFGKDHIMDAVAGVKVKVSNPITNTPIICYYWGCHYAKQQAKQSP